MAVAENDAQSESELLGMQEAVTVPVTEILIQVQSLPVL